MNTNQIVSDFLFAAAQTGRPVEVLRVGTFTDRNGREVTITEDDLSTFVANFEAGEAGQDVPIDIDHERAAAAGWVKRLWVEGAKLLAETDWNSIGQNLVSDKVYKYLSATIDMGRKVIKSVSLVNFPAVKGLKPVELSEGVYGLNDEREGGLRQVLETLVNNISDIKSRLFDVEPIILSEATMSSTTETPAIDREKLKAEIQAELEAEMAQKRQTEAELREQVKAELETELKAKFERRQSLTEFADQVCNGDAGLSTPPAELVELMETLDDDQLEQFKKVISAKVVSFSEVGSAQNGKPKLAKLPEYARQDVKAGTLTVAELFEAKAVAGELGDYDLTEFNPEQIG